MTKKELKEYIKEMILKEVSQEDVESAKELNKELEKTKELSDELGLTKESLDTFQDYSNNELVAYIKNTNNPRAKAELRKRSQNLKTLSRTDESKKKNSEEKLDFTIKELVRLRKELKSNQNQLSKIMTDESKKEEADDLSTKINNIKKQIKELETLRFQLEK
jgi:hypothetical protein